MEEDNFIPAVWIRNACKKYVLKKETITVLDGFNMTVPRGCIYGLLGPSGCGKTTVLNCILNLKKLDSGNLLVFGSVPGTVESGIPGPRVGYAPQEVGLMPSLSISEILKYYGWSTGMTNEEVKQQTNILAKLFALPELCNKTSNLSGGEQRRVSLACALIHQPELLILDEPTVGVDSVLRNDIWDYLQVLSKGLVTIVLTTHYVDETRQAHKVGFIRNGRILSEDSPKNVLRRFNEQSLENVFVKLSILQNSEQSRTTCRESNSNDIAGLEDVDVESKEIQQNLRRLKSKYFSKTEQIKQSKATLKLKIKAQCYKYFKFCQYHYVTVFLIWLIAFAQCVFLCLSLGHNPKFIPVSIYNAEASICKEADVHVRCNSTSLSCTFLKHLEKSLFKMTYHQTEENAKYSVSLGKSYAAIILQQNYSNSLRNRVRKWIYVNSNDLKQSEIFVYQDNTNVQISQFITLYLYMNFKEFYQNYAESCRINKRIVIYPIEIYPAVYGSNEPNFSEYFIPGFIIIIMILLGTAITSTSIIMERQTKNWERTKAIGVRLFEVVFIQFLLEIIMMTIVCFTILSTVFLLFKITLRGSIGLVFCLSLHTGICGMAYGLFIALICEKESDATILSLGTMMPILLLSGCAWPFAGMHVILQKISLLVPIHASIEALRSIMQKGWGLYDREVYWGFIMLSIWIIMLLTICLILTKRIK